MRLLILCLALMGIGLPVPQARAETLCTLVADAATGTVVLEQGDCDSRVTPASTFKLALAVMGYDAGILTDAHHPVMAFRDGDPDWGGDNWRRDTDPTDWLRYSVVWYSQRITRAMGMTALTRYGRALDYGNADFSGDAGQDNGLERAWIASSLAISPREQVGFLRSLLQGTLPVSDRAMAQARQIVESRRASGWTFHGKTGGAYPRRADRSFDYARGWGWYVGWADKGAQQGGGQRLIFARLTQARARSSQSPGILTRDALLNDWPALMDQIAR